MKLKQILYIISNLLFIAGTISCIYLYPNMIETGYLGFLFITTYLLHAIITIYYFLIKDEKLNNNIVENIVLIMLYAYIILITTKYKQLSNDIYEIDTLYFKINYVVASISLLSLTFNKILIRTNNNRNSPVSCLR